MSGVHLRTGREFWPIGVSTPYLPGFLGCSDCLTLYITLHLFPFQLLFKCVHKVDPAYWDCTNISSKLIKSVQLPGGRFRNVVDEYLPE